jgi:hypothetical protein
MSKSIKVVAFCVSGIMMARQKLGRRRKNIKNAPKISRGKKKLILITVSTGNL